MGPFTLLLATQLANLAACAATVHQTTSIPQGWQQLGTANPAQKLLMSLALKQDGMQHLDSTITSGVRLSREEARDLRAPNSDSVTNVMHWLDTSGLLNDTSLHNEWIHVFTNVSNIQNLLNTTLRQFSFQGGPPVLRSFNYTLPPEVSDDIDFAFPFLNFMAPKHGKPFDSASIPEAKANQTEAAGPGPVCANGVTPDCIKTLYNITKTGEDKSNVIVGIAGFLEEHASHSDMEIFAQQFAPNMSTSFDVELVNSGMNPQDKPGYEATLDIQYAKAVGPPQGRYKFYSTGGRGVMLDLNGNNITVDNSNEPYTEFLDYLLNKPDDQLPHVVSISYGDDELSVPREYAIRVCNYLGLLAARGVSFIASSGDGGASGGQPSSCVTHDGTGREVTMGTFPATCPWVTGVGGTTIAQEPPSGIDFSSGGFSQYFPRPWWQNGPVDDYIRKLDGHLDGKFNGAMRAFPDVAGLATGFSIIMNGTRNTIAGTSASAPVFAGMIGRIDNIRLSMGKPSLGWLNGHLYSSKVRAVLQDITTGTSLSCVWNGTAPGGWPAAVGWDAMTGLGVPNDFYALMKILVEV